MLVNLPIQENQTDDQGDYADKHQPAALIDT
jgi:hypothetical protein